MHPDDARMDAIWQRCGELGMPVILHVADPVWMYQKMDATNDGLMNAWKWRLDNKPNIVDLLRHGRYFRSHARQTPQHNLHRLPLHESRLRSRASRRNVRSQSKSLRRHLRPLRRNRAIPRFAADSTRSMPTASSTALTWDSEKSMYRVTFQNSRIPRRAFLRVRPIRLSLGAQRFRPDRRNS